MNEELGLVDGIDHLELYLQRTYGKNVILVQFNKESENFLDHLKKQFSLKVFSNWLFRFIPIPSASF